MKPHKHAELIKAWADGAKIELKTATGAWVEAKPDWDVSVKYRVKHEPVINYLFYRVMRNCEIEFIGMSDQIDLEYWNLKLTFTDGALTNAEVAK